MVSWYCPRERDGWNVACRSLSAPAVQSFPNEICRQDLLSCSTITTSKAWHLLQTLAAFVSASGYFRKLALIPAISHATRV